MLCLAGINTAIYSTSGTNSGIGFAIPVDTIRLSVEQILQNGKVVRYVPRIRCTQWQQARFVSQFVSQIHCFMGAGALSIQQRKLLYKACNSWRKTSPDLQLLSVSVLVAKPLYICPDGDLCRPILGISFAPDQTVEQVHCNHSLNAIEAIAVSANAICISFEYKSDLCHTVLNSQL